MEPKPTNDPEEQWDRQIAQDAKAGKLDKLAAEAIAEHEARKKKAGEQGGE